MHLRAPSIAKGTQAGIWSLVFFLFIFFGLVVIDIPSGTALVVALVSAFLIFVFVRTYGDARNRG